MESNTGRRGHRDDEDWVICAEAEPRKSGTGERHAVTVSRSARDKRAKASGGLGWSLSREDQGTQRKAVLSISI